MKMSKSAVTLAVVLSLAACKKETTTDISTDTTAPMTDTTADLPTSGTSMTDTSMASGPDSDFATKAAAGGMAEVELSTMAKDKATNADVKAFATKMVEDHSKANDELKSIAGAKGMALPTELDPEHKAIRDQLSTATGADFDRAYMEAMVSDHQKAVSDFEMESTSGTDAELKAFASKTLPTLQDHSKMAQDTAAKVKQP